MRLLSYSCKQIGSQVDTIKYSRVNVGKNLYFKVLNVSSIDNRIRESYVHYEGNQMVCDHGYLVNNLQGSNIIATALLLTGQGRRY